MKLRDYQTRLSKEAAEILQRKKIVYLAMEVRTGKTITALQTAELFAAKRVLFLTKKKSNTKHSSGLRQLRIYLSFNNC